MPEGPDRIDSESRAKARARVRQENGRARRPARPHRIVHVLALLLSAGAASFSTACATDDGGPRRTVTGEAQTPRSQDGDGERVTSLVDSDCDDRDLLPDEDNLATIEQATLCLVNAERRARDRPALHENSQLAEAADRKSRHMVRERYLAHVGPDGRDVVDWAKDSGYASGEGGFRVVENLGWGSEGGAAPETIVLGWMQSQGHRRNLLDEAFRDSGIGVALGAPRDEGGGGATYTHMLGVKK
jgi:uncharacterized protein YkwD